MGGGKGFRELGLAFGVAIGMGVGAAAAGQGSCVTRVRWPGGARYFPASISNDGRYLLASTDRWVRGKVQGARVVVRDLISGRTEVASRDNDGHLLDVLGTPSMSFDGRVVVFEATTDPDAVYGSGVYVHYADRGDTHLVAYGWSLANSSRALSADGRHVAMEAPDFGVVALLDLVEGTIAFCSMASDGTQGNSVSRHSSISPNGRYVAFESHADNLVSDDGNGVADVFLHDRETKQTIRVSVASDGSEGDDSSGFAFASDDGDVVFTSFATNLVAGDTNGLGDVFVHERATGTTRRLSIGPNGEQGGADSIARAISADGRIALFSSKVVEFSAADTLGKTQVWATYVPDAWAWLLSADCPGNPGDGDSWVTPGGGLSTDGYRCVFSSYATNLTDSRSRRKAPRNYLVDIW